MCFIIAICECIYLYVYLLLAFLCSVPYSLVHYSLRAYKPLVLEVKAWPTPNLQCSPEGSPFDSPPHKEKTRLAERPVRLARVTPKQPVVPLEEKKAGYCECCRAHFTDAKMVCLTRASFEMHVLLVTHSPISPVMFLKVICSMCVRPLQSPFCVAFEWRATSCLCS